MYKKFCPFSSLEFLGPSRRSPSRVFPNIKNSFLAPLGSALYSGDTQRESVEGMDVMVSAAQLLQQGMKPTCASQGEHGAPN